MPTVDLLFPVHGGPFPRHHSYELFASVCRLTPGFHADTNVGVFRLRGLPAGDRIIPDGRTALRLRLPAERIPEALPLAGNTLSLDGAHLRIGTPRVWALEPAASLYAPLVLIKLAALDGEGVRPERFLDAAGAQLADMGIRAELSIPSVSGGPHRGEPRRRILHVKHHRLAGYAVLARGLSAEDSVHLQERGLGGKRRMGCGLFVPVGGEKEPDAS